jgi:hypothetical protein
VLLLLVISLCGCSLSDAAEIGFDLGLTAQLDRDHIVDIGFPRPGRQIIRVGLALSERDELEIAPAFLYSSADSFSTSRSTIVLGLSYLRGRVSGGHPSPYGRVGVRWQSLSLSEPYSSSASQFSLSGGAGLKWRVGRVVGLRTDASVERRFRSSGFGAGWNLILLAGVSAFTN